MSGQVIELTIGTSEANSAKVFAWRVEGEGDYSWDVVGESAYQRSIEEIVGPEVPEDGVEIVDKLAILVAEGDNEHDENAVAVYVDGRKVGYLASDDAANFHGDLLEVSQEYDRPCAAVVCGASIRGGFTRPDGSRAHFGVFLDLDLPLI